MYAVRIGSLIHIYLIQQRLLWAMGNCALGSYCLAVTQLKNCIVFHMPKCPMPNCQWPIAKAIFIELGIYESRASIIREANRVWLVYKGAKKNKRETKTENRKVTGKPSPRWPQNPNQVQSRDTEKVPQGQWREWWKKRNVKKNIENMCPK